MVLLAITVNESMVGLLLELDEFAIAYAVLGVYFVFGAPTRARAAA